MQGDNLIIKTLSSFVILSYKSIIDKLKTTPNKTVFFGVFYKSNPIFIPSLVSIQKHMFRPYHIHLSHHNS